MKARRIVDYCGGRDNNFNLARFVAASLVIFTHAFGVTGHGGHEPFRAAYGVSAGTWAVNVFFVMSGFLVTKSYDSRRSLLAFLHARLMRIYPAMWACVLVCVFGFGLAYTSRPLRDYLVNLATAKFAIANATLLPWGVITGLPGVFESSPVQGVNESLWTLPYELRMYLAVAFLGATGLLFRRYVLPLLFGALTLAFFVPLASSGSSPAYGRLGFFFASGMVLYHWRRVIPLTWPGALVALGAVGGVLAVPHALVRELVLELVTPYLVIFFTFVPGGWLRRFNRFGDFSYGLYVYAFPVQQALVASFPGHGPTLNMLASMAGTLALAVPSWYLVEKPALSRKLPERWAPTPRLEAPGSAMVDSAASGE